MQNGTHSETVEPLSCSCEVERADEAIIIWAAAGAAEEAEAVAQALCMQTEDFSRAYHAFANKQKPVFEGN